MNALQRHSSSQHLPLTHGLLRASGETIAGPRPRDWLDVFVDDHGDLVVLLLDVRGTSNRSRHALADVAASARGALCEHAPLHAVVNALEVQLATEPGAEAGLALLRLSQSAGKVELLNAGMPALASMGPGGRLELFPAMSDPVGRRVAEVHPYEILPLTWGATWFAASRGLLGGSLESDDVALSCGKLDLAERGVVLASSRRDELYDEFQRLHPSPRFVPDDATGVFVFADPGARFQSSILG